MLTPYDLGDLFVVEDCHKLKVDELVSEALKSLKLRLLQSQIQVLGVDVSITTSRTKFNGERLWFSCPRCNKRIGVLFKHPTSKIVGCRTCLNLKYKKQRFKGMIEASI